MSKTEHQIQSVVSQTSTIVSHNSTGSEAQADFSGSVEPVSIVPNLPSVPSGAQFSLTLTLSTPPAPSSTIGVYIQPVQMPIHTIPLKGQVQGGSGIEILSAEMRLDIGSPLAVVRYTERGVEPQYGLRLDIGKRVFIDHLDDIMQERVLQSASPVIADLVSANLRAKHIEPVSARFDNLDVNATGQGVPTNAVSMQLIMVLLPNQKQQPIQLLAPTVTEPSQYVISVLGHDSNNNPTTGVSTTITVYP